MNKSELKSFATYARRELLEKVVLRAKGFGMDIKNNISLVSNGEQLIVNGTQYPFFMRNAFESLKRQYDLKGYEQLIEEAAYTWFNRMIAIRYMEIHEYLPEKVNVLSSSSGKFEPDILLHYHSMELDVDKLHVRELLDHGDYEEAYRILFIAQCNALQPYLPFLFERIDDFTALLLPNYLLDNESIINKLSKNEELSSSFKEVEVIGWLYQFYMSELKEQVGGLRNNSVRKEDLPIVTQLFTPRWIVEYMVQNSLGKIYHGIQPNSYLVDKWDYFMPTDTKLPIPKVESIEKIKILDPACGSCHILVYAFDILFEMYLEAGYFEQDIPKLILENNLYGLDIDKRASQLANFAIYMKAQEKNRRFLRRSQGLNSNIIEITDSVEVSNEAISLLTAHGVKKDLLITILSLFKNAKQFGSLIEVNIDPKLIKKVIELIDSLDDLSFDLVDQTYLKEIQQNILPILKQAYFLALRYEVVITNPPYHNKYNPQLKKFMETCYFDYKSDLYSAFIYRCSMMIVENGFSALMTPYTWMFISSHEKLRRFIISNQTISSLVQLEYSAFTEATVPICTFVIQNQKFETKGKYVRLEQFKGDQAIKVREACMNPVSYLFEYDCEKFKEIPGMPFAYWVSEKILKIYRENPLLGDFADAKKGLDTGENERFLRYWYEVDITNTNIPTEHKTQPKWYKAVKGGTYRKWFGNMFYVINWENNGQEIKNSSNSNIRNETYYFREGVTWTDISSSRFGVRYLESNCIFINGGPCIFFDNVIYLLSFMSSNVFEYLVKISSMTLHFEVGQIKNVPFRLPNDESTRYLDQLSNQILHKAKEEWDLSEISWGYSAHPIFKYKRSRLADAFHELNIDQNNRKNFIENSQIEVNRFFIESFELEDEVNAHDINEVWLAGELKENDVSKSFISYFIGCVLGRYSVVSEGLCYAGGEYNKSKYKSFFPNLNGIVIITGAEYFERDIISRLREFLAVTFSSETVEENMRWIGESLGLKKNESVEDRIRRYLLDEFFKDHCLTYQKRPIYWLVDSGKHKGLRTLVYIHRYQPDTMATIRFEHLQAIQAKYFNEISSIEMRLTNPSLSATEKRALEKKKEDFQMRIEELTEFDKLLAEYANAQIQIDLDDGVKVNYEKFKGVLAKIK